MIEKIQPKKLSQELEHTLLAGVIWGAVSPESLDPRELSVPGQNTLRVVNDLLLAGNAPPIPLPAILIGLTEAYGVNRATGQAYLESIKATLPSVEGAENAVRKLREKHTLLSIANLASGQLQRNEFDIEKITQVLSATGTTKAPVPLYEQIREGLPPPPPRLALSLLPQFTERIGGGLIGLTVVAGPPAIGKSRLVWQIALDVNSHGTPVIYYDLDNGLGTLMERTRQIFEGDLDRILASTQRLYFRDSIRTLDSDLVYIPAPALVVVDIFQALPVSQEFERQGLGHWIHRLGALRRRGYHVLVVSEVSRAFYGQAGMGAFKGSGEIEYTADLGLQMVPTTNGAALEILKNRHSPAKGQIVSLVTERGTLWKEIGEEIWTPSSSLHASSSSF